MGGGKPKNRQKQVNVAATAEPVTLSSSLVAGASSGQADGDKNICICNFKTAITISGNLPEDLRLGSQVFFVPLQEPNVMSMLFGKYSLGNYQGKKAKLLWRCANKGFEYIGTVSGLTTKELSHYVELDIGTSGRE